MKKVHEYWWLWFLVGWVTGALSCPPLFAQTAPFGPDYIIIVDPTNEGSDHRGPNPVKSRNVTIEWEHTCDTCGHEVTLDDKETVMLVTTRGQTKYQFTLLDVEVGDHTVQVEVTNDTPCPPATERPTGCSKYFTFTVLPDGTIIQAPTGLRILPVNPPPGGE